MLRTSTAIPIRAWAPACLIAAAGLWIAAMAPRLAAQLAFGPICSGHGLYALHCPACYAAAVLALAGVLLAGAASKTSSEG